jgi:hypothetical protein
MFSVAARRRKVGGLRRYFRRTVGVELDIMKLRRHGFIDLGISACLACSPARSPISYSPATSAYRPSVVSVGLPSALTGSISGRIVGDDVRAPLDQAVIGLDNGAARSWGDSLGRFQFRDVNPGRHIMVTRRIGYYRSVDTIVVVQSSDTEIQIVMRRDDRPPIGVCAGVGRPGVVLSVFPVGSSSGLPTVVPTVPRAASVVLSDRDFVERIAISSIPSQPDGVRRVYAANERPGTYQIEVSAPGFRPWRRTDVIVATTKCGELIPVQLDVHLEPLAGPPG